MAFPGRDAVQTIRMALVVLLTLSVCWLPAAEPNAERVDAFGDPLPPNAVRRIGSVHFRPGGAVHTLIPCPDRKTLLSSSAYSDRTICLWEAATGRLLRRFPGSWQHRPFALSPDGKIITTVGDEEIRLLDFASGRELRRLKGHRFGTVGLGFSPDGKVLASCGVEDIRLWDVAKGEEIAKLPVQLGGFGTCLLAFTPDGKTLIAGQGFNPTIHVWDVVNRRESRVLTRSNGMKPWSFALSPDGVTLATGSGDARGSGDGVIPLWQVAKGEIVRQLPSEQKAIIAVAFSPNGKLLASAGGERGAAIRTIIVWDLATGKPRHSFKAPAPSLAFSRDGKTLFAGGDVIRRWDMATGEEIQPPEDNSSRISTVALAPDGRRLATLGEDVLLWDTNTGKRLRRLAVEGERLSGCSFSPDGKTLATVSFEGSVRLWDAPAGKEVRLIRVPVVGQPLFPNLKGEPLAAVAFSPDGKLLITSSLQGTICLLDALTGAEVRRFGRQPADIESVAFSADNRRMFAAARTREGTDVRAWEASRGNELAPLTAAINVQMAKIAADRFNYSNHARLTLSPDGRMMALNREKTISVWESATGKERLRLKGHTEPTLAVAFSPDGRLLASSARDSTLRLWDVATGIELRQLPGHRGNIHSLVFSPDGKRLYSGGDDTSVLVWDVASIARRGLPAVPHLAAPTAWDDLAAEDAAKAYRAVHALRADPSAALPLLGERLRPAAPVDAKRVAELIRGLDSSELRVRANASEELQKLGGAVEPALRRTLQETPTLEARRRIDQLLEKLILPDVETMRQLRALEVLEHIGSAEARQMLQKFAHGAPEARLTREAKAALDRLTRR